MKGPEYCLGLTNIYSDLANSLNIYSHNVIGVSDYDDDSHHLELTNQCRRLLLEAGADPTVDPNGDYRGSFLNRMLDTGTTVVKHNTTLFYAIIC